ncbi:ribosomal RNA processing protein [Punctularia strigosozonata HHB-11173 SS5]|uniref:ribosomal RNA processing protein n=1 Tax=Punctularia strigosozonata (strain HHB-11173) TaxID=741275 RepID=UPI0004417D8D|nr:ribosomal RNA processing protein [Punctularia strigosozonata HHB-11173 SS5]EIN13934.1 ribosomal RNA processing protein [Punctularia strigosozonata HHB-11173 SS5]
MAAGLTSTPPLAKYLASTDKKTRDRAIKQLSAFLSQSSADDVDEPTTKALLPQAEMAKLWKGIFYCFWMSDKPLVQQALAAELAEMLLTIKSTCASLDFLRGFWDVIVREWSGIDRLRMDKYYMLVRRFLNASFRLLMRDNWNEPACAEYTQIMLGERGPLCPTNQRIPQSLAYHVADIYIEELGKALESVDAATTTPGGRSVPLAILFSPFFEFAARTPVKALYQRVQEAVLNPLFDSLPSLPPGSDDEDEEQTRTRKRPRLSSTTSSRCTSLSQGQPDHVRQQLLQLLFDKASASEVRDANRRRIYAFWRDAGGGE